MAYRTAKQVIIGNDDEDIEEYLHSNPSIKFSTYVKELIRLDMKRKEHVDPLESIEAKLDTLLKIVKENGVAAQKQPAPVAPAAKKQLSEGSKKAAASLMGAFNVKGGQ